VGETGPSCSRDNASLAVKVTDYQNRPIAGVDVKVDGVGEGTTDQNGLADFGDVAGGTYHITVWKEGYRPDPNAIAGPVVIAATVPDGSATVIPAQLAAFSENIIFVGSEMDYDSFWTKMMFISAAWFESTNGSEFRTADRKTIAYVDEGYTRFEKLTIDYLQQKQGFYVVKLAVSMDIVGALNDRLKPNSSGVKEYYLLQDVVFFSHGQPDAIKLNFNTSPDVNLSSSELGWVDTDIFMPGGRFFSYACRTGVASWDESFSSDQDANLDQSVAQQIANRLKVETHAFLTRSDYGKILRERSDSTAIADSLKKSRETADGTLIEIPPDHQGLPHPGLYKRRGARKEGTNEYALWRKAGGIRLPDSAPSPTGLTKGLHVFTPK